MLAELLAEYSRTRIKEWIEAGQVLVERRASCDPRTRFSAASGSRSVRRVEPDAGAVAPSRSSWTSSTRTATSWCINKPAGLVVHPGAGNAAGTLQNALLHFDPKLAQVPRAGIVHRLDKDTSGLMVVARTLEAHTALVRAIEAREVEREYEAVCVGRDDRRRHGRCADRPTSGRSRAHGDSREMAAKPSLTIAWSSAFAVTRTCV